MAIKFILGHCHIITAMNGVKYSEPELGESRALGHGANKGKAKTSNAWERRIVYRCRFCGWEMPEEWDDEEALRHLLSVHPSLVEALSMHCFVEVERSG